MFYFILLILFSQELNYLTVFNASDDKISFELSFVLKLLLVIEGD